MVLKGVYLVALIVSTGFIPQIASGLPHGMQHPLNPKPARGQALLIITLSVLGALAGLICLRICYDCYIKPHLDRKTEPIEAQGEEETPPPESIDNISPPTESDKKPVKNSELMNVTSTVEPLSSSRPVRSSVGNMKPANLTSIDDLDPDTIHEL